jgi:hypothetical protein
MPKRLLPVVVLLTALSGVAYADARADAKAQVEFGISVAQRGLWKEAIYRWERATQIDPTYAAGFNNLAVACRLGRRRLARRWRGLLARRFLSRLRENERGNTQREQLKERSFFHGAPGGKDCSAESTPAR